MIFTPRSHITQAKEWGEFKAKMGSQPVRVGDLQFTKHKMPGLPFYIGYAPKVNFAIQNFSFKELEAVAREEKCAVIRFDVPNVIKRQDNADYRKSIELVENHCVRAPIDTFTKSTVLMDLSPSETELMSRLTQKTRYNVRLAGKKGVEIKVENSSKGMEVFYKLHKTSSGRLGFSVHPQAYFQKMFETLNSYGMVNILIAQYKQDAIAAWMLINYEKNLYYPFGGSDYRFNSLMGSNLLAWEAIKLGKRLNCTLFDMWGAQSGMEGEGYTKFKLGYGGELVGFMDSHDFVINRTIYKAFNVTYGLFWKLKRAISL